MPVLFSPIGTADPLTQLGEGPMLHIVRHRKPSVVVLFLSPEMARHQQVDARYTRAIERLARETGMPAPLVKTIKSTCDEVYRFDRFITIFEEILENLSEEYPSEELICNVSSGTPAMEQALVALGSFGRLEVQLLQVLTPRGGVSRKDDREDPESYDLDFLFDYAEDVEMGRGFESRIVEVESPNFYDRVMRENVVALVQEFEYNAAYRLASQMSLIEDSTKEMIAAAADRLKLNGQKAACVFSGTELSWKANDPLAEYLYIMEVQLEQGRWADYLRAMTPALTEIMKRVLDRSGLPEKSYMEFRDGSSTGKCDPEKVNANRRLSRVFNLKGNKPVYVTDQQLAELVKEYCDDARIVALVSKLRNMEFTRNSLSHEIRPAMQKALEREGGMSMQEVFDSFVSLHDWLVPNQKMVPGLYRRISEKIVEMI